MELTSLRPKWRGANSTERTVPLASTRTARSIHREAFWLFAPLACDSDSEYVCSQIFTVRSNEDDARIAPNSGCAHESLDTVAS